MVTSCCAVGCTNRADQGSNISFHRIPTQENRRKDWLNAIKRLDPKTKKPWVPSTIRSYICSDHFEPDSFLLSKHARNKLLKPEAIPSIFQWKDNQKTTSRQTKNTLKVQSHCSLPLQREEQKPIREYSAVDHSYAVQPETLKRKYFEVMEELKNTKKDLCNAKRREKRSKLTTAAWLQELKDLRKLSEHTEELLNEYKDIPLELFKKPSHQYSEDQKQFATTLFYYGPKSYEYIRGKFSLPHPSTIRKWLSSIDSKPGISQQVLDMLGKKKTENPTEYSYCSIMIDGMSIRKRVEWDPKEQQMVGFINLGSGNIDSDVTEAREALVILAVGITGHWKVPIGYFLIDGISAEVQAQLIFSSLSSLLEVGVRAVAVVMDGHPTNQKMAGLLGCSLDPDNLISYFSHPSQPSLNVYLFFDACHLLKNLRGALHSLRELSEESIGTAFWSDIVKLQNLQSEEGLRAANKLTSKHIDFHQQKMNVKLAAQTLSSSVAKGLEFAAASGSRGFANCNGTIKFISIVDQMFDIFNSRTPAIKYGFKSPIRANNIPYIEMFLTKTKTMLLNLKDMTQKRVCTGKRKISVIGFSLNIDSLLGLAKELLLPSSESSLTMHYILTYKLSQDHLELLFSAIRRYGGWNNNPSAAQFSAAYRSLLGHAGILIYESSSSNCIPQDTTSILNIENHNNEPVLTFEEALYDHDYSTYRSLSTFVDGILEYIAGWVVRKVTSKIACPECAESLIQAVSSNKMGCYN